MISLHERLLIGARDSETNSFTKLREISYVNFTFIRCCKFTVTLE